MSPCVRYGMRRTWLPTRPTTGPAFAVLAVVCSVATSNGDAPVDTLADIGAQHVPPRSCYTSKLGNQLKAPVLEACADGRCGCFNNSKIALFGCWQFTHKPLSALFFPVLASWLIILIARPGGGAVFQLCWPGGRAAAQGHPRMFCHAWCVCRTSRERHLAPHVISFS